MCVCVVMGVCYVLQNCHKDEYEITVIQIGEKYRRSDSVEWAGAGIFGKEPWETERSQQVNGIWKYTYMNGFINQGSHQKFRGPRTQLKG